jgi:hypothetical protein
MLDYLYAAGVALSLVGLLAGAVLTLLGSTRMRQFGRIRPPTWGKRVKSREAGAFQPIDHPV